MTIYPSLTVVKALMELHARTTQRIQSKPRQERKKSVSGEEAALESTALLASTSTAVTDVPYADDEGGGGGEEEGTADC